MQSRSLVVAPATGNRIGQSAGQRSSRGSCSPPKERRGQSPPRHRRATAEFGRRIGSPGPASHECADPTEPSGRRKALRQAVDAAAGAYPSRPSRIASEPHEPGPTISPAPRGRRCAARPARPRPNRAQAHRIAQASRPARARLVRSRSSFPSARYVIAAASRGSGRMGEADLGGPSGYAGCPADARRMRREAPPRRREPASPVAGAAKNSGRRRRDRTTIASPLARQANPLRTGRLSDRSLSADTPADTSGAIDDLPAPPYGPPQAGVPAGWAKPIWEARQGMPDARRMRRKAPPGRREPASPVLGAA